MAGATPPVTVSGPTGRVARRRRPPWRIFLALLLSMVLLGTAAVGLWWAYNRSPAVPSAQEHLARAIAARTELRELAFTLSTPWPQAYPAAGRLPGAKVVLSPVEGQRVWRVLWHETLGMRAELREPAELAGNLTIVTPEGYWIYSPLLKVAIGGQPGTVPALYLDELLELAMDAGTLRNLGPGGHAGRETIELAAGLDTSPPLELRLSLDEATALPLRASLVDETGRVLGTLAVSELDLAPAAGEDDYAFIPPAGTTVLASGTMRVFPSLALAAPQLPFEPLVPAYLPAGFALEAVNILGEAERPALILTYRLADEAAASAGLTGGLLSLTQSVAAPGHELAPYGQPVSHEGWSGRQFELGELRAVDWRSGPLSLTLFGTVTFAELRRIAAGVGSAAIP